MATTRSAPRRRCGSARRRATAVDRRRARCHRRAWWCRRVPCRGRGLRRSRRAPGRISGRVRGRRFDAFLPSPRRGEGRKSAPHPRPLSPAGRGRQIATRKKTPAAFVQAAGKGRCFVNWVGVGGRSGGRGPRGKLRENGSFQAACWRATRRCNDSHSRRQQSRSRSMVSVST